MQARPISYTNSTTFLVVPDLKAAFQLKRSLVLQAMTRPRAYLRELFLLAWQSQGD
jgi:hypothetical protein